jgi:tetratricopeptide (TPR) repeat protein
MAHDHDVYMMLVEAALKMEDLSALEEYTPLLEKLAERDSHQLYLAIAKRARGALHRLRGEFADSENCLQEALSLFTDFDTRWQCGRTQFELGKSAQSRGDTKAASSAFAEALKYFEELEAKPDQERVQHALELII